MNVSYSVDLEEDWLLVAEPCHTCTSSAITECVLMKLDVGRLYFMHLWVFISFIRRSRMNAVAFYIGPFLLAFCIVELRALCMVYKYSVTKLQPQNMTSEDDMQVQTFFKRWS